MLSLFQSTKKSKKNKCKKTRQKNNIFVD